MHAIGAGGKIILWKGALERHLGILSDKRQIKDSFIIDNKSAIHTNVIL